jgi:hypothetical protein
VCGAAYIIFLLVSFFIEVFFFLLSCLAVRGRAVCWAFYLNACGISCAGGAVALFSRYNHDSAATAYTCTPLRYRATALLLLFSFIVFVFFHSLFFFFERFTHFVFSITDFIA